MSGITVKYSTRHMKQMERINPVEQYFLPNGIELKFNQQARITPDLIFKIEHSDVVKFGLILVDYAESNGFEIVRRTKE